MSFRLGYNTNGFAHHRLRDAIEVLADIGYQSVAITLDHHALNPFAEGVREEAKAIGQLLQSRNMTCVVETGARFLLDPRRKHWPTLVTADETHRRRRLDFLFRSIEIAALLDPGIVSFWSGMSDPALSHDESWALLVQACGELLSHAEKHNVRLAFEPEPGMFVETMDQFRALATELNHPLFGLTLDVGHVHCLRDGTPADRIREFAPALRNVHIEDMRIGVHDHLMFGEGEMAFEPILNALKEVRYTGPLNVELSRHSHDAVTAAQQAFNFLTQPHRK